MIDLKGANEIQYVCYAARLAAKLSFNIDAPCFETIGKLKGLLAKSHLIVCLLKYKNYFTAVMGNAHWKNFMHLDCFQYCFPDSIMYRKSKNKY